MKVWLRQFDAARLGGPFSFMRSLAAWMTTEGVTVTHDATEPGIDAALALSIIESAELRPLKWRHVPIMQRLDGVPYNTPGTDLAHAGARLRRCYEVADAIAFQSAFSKRTVERCFGAAGCETRIINNGVDLDLFRPAESMPPADPLTLVCAAQWRPHKRLAATVQGFSAYHAKNPQSRLLVIGDTERAKADAVRHAAIAYLGPLDRAQTAEAMRSAHICLHLGWLDNCPNVVIEAQATGLPVICTNSGGTPEIVDADAGEIIACDAPDSPPQSVNIYDPAVIPPIRAEDVADRITVIAADLAARRRRLLDRRKDFGIARAGQCYLDLFEDFAGGRVQRPKGRRFWALAAKAIKNRLTPGQKQQTTGGPK